LPIDVKEKIFIIFGIILMKFFQQVTGFSRKTQAPPLTPLSAFARFLQSADNGLDGGPVRDYSRAFSAG